MKATEFRSKCSELESSCIPVETMNKYIHLIITELMNPFKELGNGEWEWKNGTIYQYIKDSVRVVCLSYYRGAMSFFIEYIKPIPVGDTIYNDKYFAIWSYKADRSEEDDAVKMAFDEVCKHIETSLENDSYPYKRFAIKNIEVDKLITCGTSYKDASFGCDTIQVNDITEFLRTIDDLHLIKLYIDALDI